MSKKEDRGMNKKERIKENTRRSLSDGFTTCGITTWYRIPFATPQTNPRWPRTTMAEVRHPNTRVQSVPGLPVRFRTILARWANPRAKMATRMRSPTIGIAGANHPHAKKAKRAGNTHVRISGDKQKSPCFVILHPHGQGFAIALPGNYNPDLRPGPQPEASNSGNGLGSNLGKTT